MSSMAQNRRPRQYEVHRAEYPTLLTVSRRTVPKPCKCPRRGRDSQHQRLGAALQRATPVPGTSGSHSVYTAHSRDRLGRIGGCRRG